VQVGIQRLVALDRPWRYRLIFDAGMKPGRNTGVLQNR
jgi:hypothetical protein